jgi:predicted metal-dependent hydrolase
MNDDVPGPTFSAADAAAACQQASLPIAAQRGLELFNQQRYFEAHEELELAWRAEDGLVRELYRGILQVAVAFYHLLRGNYIGATKMLLRAQRWLAPYPEQCLGIQLAQFRQDVKNIEAEVLHLGPNQIRNFPPQRLPTISYTTEN